MNSTAPRIEYAHAGAQVARAPLYAHARTEFWLDPGMLNTGEGGVIDTESVPTKIRRRYSILNFHD